MHASLDISGAAATDGDAVALPGLSARRTHPADRSGPVTTGLRSRSHWASTDSTPSNCNAATRSGSGLSVRRGHSATNVDAAASLSWWRRKLASTSNCSTSRASTFSLTEVAVGAVASISAVATEVTTRFRLRGTESSDTGHYPVWVPKSKYVRERYHARPRPSWLRKARSQRSSAAAGRCHWPFAEAESLGMSSVAIGYSPEPSRPSRQSHGCVIDDVRGARLVLPPFDGRPQRVVAGRQARHVDADRLARRFGNRLLARLAGLVMDQLRQVHRRRQAANHRPEKSTSL